jgi:hypothetical protein
MKRASKIEKPRVLSTASFMGHFTAVYFMAVIVEWLKETRLLYSLTVSITSSLSYAVEEEEWPSVIIIMVSEKLGVLLFTSAVDSIRYDFT